jgi:hypothetical protein
VSERERVDSAIMYCVFESRKEIMQRFALRRLARRRENAARHGSGDERSGEEGSQKEGVCRSGWGDEGSSSLSAEDEVWTLTVGEEGREADVVVGW